MMSSRETEAPKGQGQELLFLFVFLGLNLFFVAADVIGDLRKSEITWLHFCLELVPLLLNVTGLVYIAVRWRALKWGLSAAESRAIEAEARVLRSADELRHWQAKTEALASGLSRAIDQQLSDWGLSAAEKDVSLLLLKGFSCKEIAEFRSTSERTVRQQAANVYQKAGLAGRSELSAFFLEDILTLHPEPVGEA